MKDNTGDCGGGGGGGGWKKEVVSDLTITIEADDDNKGDYIKLMPGSDECLPLTAVEMVEECSLPSRRSVVWYWVKLVLLFLSLGFLAVAILKWVGPYLIDKVCAFFFSSVCFYIWIVLWNLGLFFFRYKILFFRMKIMHCFCI